jgi:hypothetical protein
MASQDDLTLLKRMYQRGEISDEQYDVLRRHVLWGTPLPQLIDEVPPPRAAPPPAPVRAPDRRGGSPGYAPEDPLTAPWRPDTGFVRAPDRPGPAPGPKRSPTAYDPGPTVPPAAPRRPSGYGEPPAPDRGPSPYRTLGEAPADRDPVAYRPPGEPPADRAASGYHPSGGRRDQALPAYHPLGGPPAADRDAPAHRPMSDRPGPAHRPPGEPPAADRDASAYRPAGEAPGLGRGAAAHRRPPVDRDETSTAHPREPEPARRRRESTDAPQVLDRPRRPARRRGLGVLAVLTSLVLALALVAAGVWWFALREIGVDAPTYARSVCAGVRDWQRVVDTSSSTLVKSIPREENRSRIRSSVQKYYTDLAARTDGLRATIDAAGPVDVPGGRAYADSLAAAVGDQSAALRDLAARAGRLNVAAATTFQTSLQSLLTGAETAVSDVTAALARPAAGTPAQLRRALSDEPACAPYVG